jgi:CBS domain-containing protein
MANGRSSTGSNGSRAKIARNVLIVSISALPALAGLVIWFDRSAARDVFNMMLPVFAAWVGTILAFYFSRENFESAGRQVTEIVKQVTPLERLRSLPVTSHMIKRDDMIVFNLTAGKGVDAVKIVGDILNLMISSRKNRLPVLDENDRPRYMIHRSMIDKYLAGKALKESARPGGLGALTLRDLLEDDADLRKMFETSFAAVPEDATLAEAKFAMEAVTDCLDVFVTKRGTKNEPIIGWLTNVIIAKCSEAR